jgi:hypothetical protein
MYQVIKTFGPDETDLHVCHEVVGTELAYSEEFLENGIPSESYVYCLGRVGE